MLSTFFSFIILLAPIFAFLIAITIHEFSHAAVADHLGDPTPRLMGRLTLNPVAHLDPIGTLLPLFLFLTRSPVVFGWGKPVPIDPFNLREPRRDQALISLAGPASNLIFAVFISFFLRLFSIFNFQFSIFNLFFSPLILLNVTLAIFNLLPIHPLDGFKIVAGLLPQEQAYKWEELASYGPLFLFLLIFPGIFGRSLVSQVLSPIINFLLQILIPYGYTVI